MSSGGARLAIALLRTGRPVRIEGPALTVCAVETTTQELLDLRDPDHRARLMISGNRAAALKLANERDAADPGRRSQSSGRHGSTSRPRSRLPIPAAISIEPERPLSCRCAGVARGEQRGSFCWHARLVCFLLCGSWIRSEPITVVSLDEILRERAQPAVEIVARAKLPLDDLPPTQIVAFRGSDDGLEHVALVVGAFGGKPPLVRLHSECLTGDVFGSLKCDCGPQLKEALKIIGAEGGGILSTCGRKGAALA